MGLFRKFAQLRHRLAGPHAAGLAPAREKARESGLRQCRFETMEPRQLMAADVHFGATFFEPDEGTDEHPDIFQVTFEGGADGTQLTRLIINGDKRKDGLTDSDIFFDISPDGLGIGEAHPFKVLSSEGFEVTNVSVVDGGMVLIIDFRGFDAGEKLVFSIDTDEANFIFDDGTIDISPIVDGSEFQRSHLTGHFIAPHYEELVLDTTFWDDYDPYFQQAARDAGTTLNLPNDAHSPGPDVSNRTAGAVAHAPQVPLPISISGTVYVDMNQNNLLDGGEKGLAGVKLGLWKFDEATGQYVDTGKTVTTDANGFYKFDNRDGVAILPGQYEVRETQPAGYFSVGASAGKIDGQTSGAVLNPNVISRITILGGQDSVQNNFAEALPAEISGYVYHDANNNGQRDTGEGGIAGVRLDLVAIDTLTGYTGTISVVTDANGYWQATGLVPGQYKVLEVQPVGWIDGKDSAGQIGGKTVGNAINPGDEIRNIVLTSGQKGINYNFGELLPSSISGRVHADPEGDCVFGPNDIPLQGVQIDLYNAQGQKIATTYTDKDGRYKFDGLGPGQYTIYEHQPAGYFDSGDHIGTAGGYRNGNDRISGITLVSGTKGENYNFCELLPSSISGRVHADPEGDCVFGPNDIPLEGVQIDLFNEQGEKIATTYTDKDGRYKFDNLGPGKYTIFEHQPEGYFDSGDHVGTAGGQRDGNDRISGITLVSGTKAENYNFCELLPSSISGRVHADPEGDCTFGPNDIPLEGVQIDLFNEQGQKIATTYTDKDGRYKFDNLGPGKYTIFEHQPEGYFDGGDHIGTAGGEKAGNDRISGITLVSGTHAAEYNFCENVPLTLSGYVYHDADNDGIRESGEQGIGGVTLILLDAHGNDTGQRVTTNAQGFYKFEGLAPGTYRVREVQPTGWLDGIDTPGNLGGTAVNPGDQINDIVLTFGKHGVNYNFGELLPSSISGRVHADPEGDCTFGPNDIPLEGVQVDLYNEQGQKVATTYTNKDGIYRFDNLGPGKYTIFEHQPEGYFDGGEKIGSAGGVKSGNDRISGITLVSGTIATDYDFCEHVPLKLSGYVYHDANNNGKRDGSEQGIGGVTLVLLDEDCNDTGITVVTDASGYYEFTGLAAGTYGVREIQPTGWLDGRDSVGNLGGIAQNPGDKICQVEINWGETARDYNFGELLPGSIRGQVIADENGNCTLDPGEKPLAGVVIELYDNSGKLLQTTLTDKDGIYEFTGLAPGKYQIRERQPEGYFHQAQKVGTGGGVVLGQDHIGGIEVGSGVHLVGYNFCEIPPATISGYVFQDGDVLRTRDGQAPDNLHELRDGQRDAGDTPLAGVVLELRDGVTGERVPLSQVLPGMYSEDVIRVTTDAHGYYEFVGLPPGVYAVFQIHPEGFTDGIDTPGTTGGVAANPHQPLDGQTLARLTQDPANDAILQIRVGAGQTSAENNFSEVVIEKQPEIIFFPQDPAPRLAPLPPTYVAPLEFLEAPPIMPATYETLGYHGRAGKMLGYTWHLSVVNTGQPRSQNRPDLLVRTVNTRFDLATWHAQKLDMATWTWLSSDGTERSQLVFGHPHGIPVVGDFNGDGVAEVGVFLRGEWFLDVNGNGIWDEGDLWAKLGTDGDQPVIGDWDGDGKDDIGIFGPAWPGDPRAVANEPGLPDPENQLQVREKNLPPSAEDAAVGARTMKLTAQGTLRADVIDHVFHYGAPGDKAITGDWNGADIRTIGVFRNGRWHLDVDGDGRWTENDIFAEFGQEGDIPVVGDWTGDGIDKIGVFRAGKWYLDTNNNHVLDANDQVFELGKEGDIPIVGDFNGDGIDQIGVYSIETPVREATRR